MKKKYFVIFIISISFLIFSEDQAQTSKTDLIKSNIIEFSFGYGAINSLTLSVDNQSYLGENNQMINNTYRSIFYSGCDGIPVSFVYYPNIYFGIGMMQETGFNIGFQIYPASLQSISLNNYFRVVNKFGRITTNNWALLEYGINLINVFDISGNNTISNGIAGIPDAYLSFGPSIFIGWEGMVYKRLEMTIGFIFNSSYHEMKWSSTYRDDYWDFDFGLEIRIRAAFFFILDKKK